jgi:hypothetical protein
MGPPPILQNLGFGFLGIVFFCVGIALACVTAVRTLKEYKNANDSWSGGALRVLLFGSVLTAVFLGPSVYGFIRFGGGLVGQMGIG